MFGFDAVAAFTHQSRPPSTWCARARSTPTRELIAVALAAKDQMRVLIEHPATGERQRGRRHPRRPAARHGSDRRICGRAATPQLGRDHACRERSGRPDQATWRIRFRLPADAMATGTNPLLLLDELRTLGTAIGDCADRWRAAARGDRSRPLLSALGRHAADRPAARGDRGRVPVRHRRHGTGDRAGSTRRRADRA